VAPPPPNLAEVKSWFAEDELKTCPHCGAHAVVQSGAATAVCLGCGDVAGIAGPKASVTDAV
jgi:hypothetical protein